jgi:putative DNA primase/helicase
MHYANEAARLGYKVPIPMSIGVRVRGAAVGKDERNKSASFFIFDDCRGGLINDFTTGEQIHINAERTADYKSISAPQGSSSAIAADKKARQQAESEKHAEGAAKARYVLSQCVATSTHPYAIRKGITTPGSLVRFSPKFKTLVLPLRDALTDEVTSLQYIDADGAKRFMPGGRIKGCYIACSEIGDRSLIYLCEGFATGRTLATAYPDAMVLAAHSCHNMKPVAEKIVKRWPDRRLIICGDDDRGNPKNPGRKSAEAAALAVGADMMLPNWPADAPIELTDFNDLALWLRAQK